MKNFIFFILLCFYACKNKTTHYNKNEYKTYALKSASKIKENLTLINNKPYTGYLYKLHLNNQDTVLLATYVNGLKNGVTKKWYNNKQLKEIRYYSQGKKNGKQISYWQNGNKRFEYTAHNDMYEGILKEWNAMGNLIHLAHYKNGQEQGEQKLWYDNGKIRANYTIKNGRRYGLLGTKNCTNVSDSIFNNY